jgi:hypothetical protein
MFERFVFFSIVPRGVLIIHGVALDEQRDQLVHFRLSLDHDTVEVLLERTR